MSAKQIKENKKGASKDTLLMETTLQLLHALPALKESLGEKKFEKRIRKAAKLLIEGIKPGDAKKATKLPGRAPKPAIPKNAPATKTAEIKSTEAPSKVSLPAKKAARPANVKSSK